MAKGIRLRKDFDAAGLRRLARGSKDSGQARRLLALAEIYDGSSRSEATAVGGVTLQSIRDWVLRFNRLGPKGLIDLKAPGPKPKLTEEQRQALKEIVERGPIPAVDEVVRWRLIVDALRRAGKPAGLRDITTALLTAGGHGEPARPSLTPRVRGNLSYQVKRGTVASGGSSCNRRW